MNRDILHYKSIQQHRATPWEKGKKSIEYVLYFTLLYFTLLYFTLLYFTLLYFQFHRKHYMQDCNMKNYAVRGTNSRYKLSIIFEGKDYSIS
jgi:hypothetical protein